MLGWVVVAAAALPLPDYTQELARAEWASINRQLEARCAFEPSAAAIVCEPGATERARARAEAYQRAVRPDAGLAYLIALAYRYDGENAASEREYHAALKLDPDHDAAWYDLGELYLISGRYPKAAEAFERVSALRQRGHAAWVGPWRRAEVAAHQSDVEAFELWIKEALARGFSFTHIEGSTPWRAFYANQALRDSIDKLVTVYGTPSTLDTLRPE